jgi:hypothetical protein
MLANGFVSSDISGGAAPFTLTMSGLTVGDQYAFEWWTNASSSPGGTNLTQATATNSVTLNWNTSAGADGGVGQFAIGHFTASATSESITFSNNGGTFGPIFGVTYAELNGVELRDLGPATAPSVPVPATAALLAVGFSGLALKGCWRRRSG